jgi:hypothetical protein
MNKHYKNAPRGTIPSLLRHWLVRDCGASDAIPSLLYTCELSQPTRN